MEVRGLCTWIEHGGRGWGCGVYVLRYYELKECGEQKEVEPSQWGLSQRHLVRIEALVL